MTQKTKSHPRIAGTINLPALNREKGRLGRVSLLENGYSKNKVAKLTDEEAWYISNEMYRRFFTGRD
jgi:hypothetical protein